ncbi:DUF72 domain-containing protein [Vreelandella zhuhanensis]|uniref:DUF72 domain-containing protein n=1 Tax=Vreelandella zhuhanensis TaxID=2684210 RepID=UPI0035303E20
MNYPGAVEVRHPEFFHKGETEKAFNQLLITYQANRVMLDVYPLFSTPFHGHSGLTKAQQEKPKLPLHVLSTGDTPVIRFIGHIDKLINKRYLAPWEKRLNLWISQGKTIFLLVHTADNREAPDMARSLYEPLAKNSHLPDLPSFFDEQQTRLF